MERLCLWAPLAGGNIKAGGTGDRSLTHGDQDGIHGLIQPGLGMLEHPPVNLGGYCWGRVNLAEFDLKFALPFERLQLLALMNLQGPFITRQLFGLRKTEVRLTRHGW